MALFEEHWTAEDGVEVPVYAHDAITLLGRTASGWRTDNARYQAACNLASDLQAKVAALEARLANPTPDDSASKTSNSAEDPSQKLHMYSSTIWVICSEKEDPRTILLCSSMRETFQCYFPPL